MRIKNPLITFPGKTKYYQTHLGLLQGVYIDLGKTNLTSDKIKLYVHKNLTAALCDMVGPFTRERLIHVLF